MSSHRSNDPADTPRADPDVEISATPADPDGPDGPDHRVGAGSPADDGKPAQGAASLDGRLGSLDGQPDQPSSQRSFTWPALSRLLREHLRSQDFRTWIRPLTVLEEGPERLLLEAPNDRFVRILEESYRQILDQLVHDHFGAQCRIELTSSQLALGHVPSPTRPLPADPNSSSSRDVSESALGYQRESHRVEARRSAEPRAAYRAHLEPEDDEASCPPPAHPSTEGITMHGSGSDEPDRPPSRPLSRRQPGSSQGAAPAQLSEGKGAAGQPSHFNPRYRFSNFVVGDSNQFASAAAHAVAESPGQSYNPLFLYGGVGLGKTHLLHAVGQEIKEQRPHLLVHYISAEQFLNELINSIRFDRMPTFRERYRTIDVLLIDDIQFLANKERTQEEFFHTFNALYTAEKQIILSSDASPKDIPTLEERLRSRFEWGLITDIQPPDLETKIAILRRKAALRRCDLDDEVAMFIAKQVRSNVRELEGLLNRVIAFSSLTGRPLDFELAKETLKEILPQADARRNAAEIIRTVAKTYGLKVTEIKSRNKSQQISFPRQVAMYLCKQLTDLSFPEIGKQFKDKHHSTVMHSVDKIAKLRLEDEELDRSIERLILQLR